MKINFKELVNISVISNITIEPYFTKKIKDLFLDTWDAIVNNISYEDYMNKTEILKLSDVILVWINIGVLAPNLHIQLINGSITYETAIESILALYNGIINKINEMGYKKIIIMTQENNDDKAAVFNGNIISDVDIIRLINNKIIDVFSSSFTILDINKLMLNIGISNAYDNINKYRWNAIYSKDLIETTALEIYKQFLIYQGVTKKCVVLDCDNVLWGGIIVEDGIDNIQLSDTGVGLYYQDFQRFILNLYYHGIILAISSKNELNDIINMFDNHSGMILKKEHISCFQVNWNNKAENILEISNFLNIGLDSIIFVDDSLFEINLVRSTLPDVTTILFDKNDNVFSKFNCINLNDKVESDIVKLRTATYQKNQERTLLQKNSINYEDYLKSLNTNIDIHLANESEINRISELSLRTNQCTNGIRYFCDKLVDVYKSQDWDLYSVYVEDIFGALGLVGAIIINKNEINLFCLSCRSLGRGVEDKMIAFLVEKYQIEKVKFIDTNKNKAIKEHLSRCFNLSL